MVKVVLAEVVLGEVGDVCGLHVGDIGGAEKTDVHGGVVVPVGTVRWGFLVVGRGGVGEVG